MRSIMERGAAGLNPFVAVGVIERLQVFGVMVGVGVSVSAGASAVPI